MTIRGDRSAVAVLRAEWKIECRHPTAFISAVLFSLIVLLCQALVLPAIALAKTDIAFSAFFISSFFSALLAEHARIARDQKTGIPSALALTPSGISGIFLGKTVSAFILITLIEVGLFPFLIIFYNLSIGPIWMGVLGMVLPANFALACLTTLLGACAGSWKGLGGTLGLPLVILPIALPILATVSIGSSRALMGFSFISYFKLLLAACISIWTIGMLTYGKLLGRQ